MTKSTFFDLCIAIDLLGERMKKPIFENLGGNSFSLVKEMPSAFNPGDQIVIKTQNNQPGHVVKILDNVVLVIPWNEGKGDIFHLSDIEKNPNPDPTFKADL